MRKSCPRFQESSNVESFYCSSLTNQASPLSVLKQELSTANYDEASSLLHHNHCLLAGVNERHQIDSKGFSNLPGRRSSNRTVPVQMAPSVSFHCPHTGTIVEHHPPAAMTKVTLSRGGGRRFNAIVPSEESIDPEIVMPSEKL